MQQPTIILIAKTQVDINNLLSLAKQATGHTISQGVDSSNMDINTLASFICVLNELLGGTGDPLTSLRDIGVLSDHIQFSFLIIGDTYISLYLLQNTSLRINITDTLVSGVSLFIATGTLSKWREAIINLTTGRENQQIRLLIDKIMLILEQEGFKEVFFDYKKQMINDGTFLLIEKK